MAPTVIIVRAVTGHSLKDCGEPGFWLSQIHPEDRSKVLADRWTLEERGEVSREFRFRHHDGGVILVRDRTAIKRTDRTCIELISVWVDAERCGKLGVGNSGARPQEALGQNIIDTSPDAFLVLDERGLVKEWSERAQGMFEINAAAARGQALDELISLSAPLHDRPDLLARFLELVAVRPGSRCRFLARSRGGAEVPIEMQLTPVRLSGRACFTGFIRDISGQVLTETRLLQAQKSAAVVRMAEILAEDFGRILELVIGTLEGLSWPGGGDGGEDVLGMARSAAMQGVELTRSLRVLAKRGGLKPEDVDVSERLQQIEPLIRQFAGPSVAVEMALAAIDALACIDPDDFQHAMLDLAANARDAMPDGCTLFIYTHRFQVAEYVDVAPEMPPGEYVAIGVDDSGCGMSAAVATMAFDPFFTTKSKGAGQGLARVYGFARRSGGTAQIQSVPGRGTVVTLLLPLVSGGAAEPQNARKPA